VQVASPDLLKLEIQGIAKQLLGAPPAIVASVGVGGRVSLAAALSHWRLGWTETFGHSLAVES
jgi:hypothetical protein